MARNEEKAQSMLNRYLGEQMGGERGRRRPSLASHCNDLGEAVRWRAQVERDIRLRVSEIQNPTLVDARARELNDAINKLLRERRHWDRRVIGLGGRASRAPPRGASEKDAFSHGGYLYFGVARELPGVRELVARAEGVVHETDSSPKESAAELYARLNPAYYNAGAPASDAGKVEAEVLAAERALRTKLAKEWEAREHTSPLAARDAPWDDSFRRYEGMKPVASAAVMTQHSHLESKKRDAMELLQAGAR